jgi:hypothetical protein
MLQVCEVDANSSHLGILVALASHLLHAGTEALPVAIDWLLPVIAEQGWRQEAQLRGHRGVLALRRGPHTDDADLRDRRFVLYWLAPFRKALEHDDSYLCNLRDAIPSC